MMRLQNKKASHEINNLMAIELTKADQDNERTSMPLIQEDLELHINWMKNQKDSTLKEVSEKLDKILVYALAYMKLSPNRRKNYGFSNYTQALEFAKK
mgnify:CR=1 FL=1